MDVLTPSPSAFASGLLVALVYLAIVRTLDLHEREPLWAIALVFSIGAVTGLVFHATTRGALFELTIWRGALALETARAAALVIGLWTLGLATRHRGWREMSGPMDGIVYGTAAGLGIATGLLIAQRVAMNAGADALALPLPPLWVIVLGQLAHGLFGAIIGAGIGAAEGRTTPRAMLLVVMAWAAAVTAHGFHLLVARGNALGGTAAMTRMWISLVLPLVAMGGLAAYALYRERRAISEELASEIDAGVVTQAELSTLRNPIARAMESIRLLARGDLARWAGLHMLHTRQVQLALAKRQTRGRDEARLEAERLRAAVHAVRAAMERRS